MRIPPVFLVGSFLVGLVRCYPTSVPNTPDVCSKMIPGHGPRPQSTPSPYEIVLNKQSMQGGHNLQIVVQGKKGEKFRGFYIQARDEDGSPIGSFQSPDENEAMAHSCFGIKDNAIHHKFRDDKDSITVYWKAPEAYEGKIKVLATVLQHFEAFWTNVQAPEPVSVTTNREFAPSFLEKAKARSTDPPKTARVLNYNPYSPYSPLASWNSSIPSEFVQPASSDVSSITFHKRHLFGLPSFDFHGGFGFHAAKFPALNSILYSSDSKPLYEPGNEIPPQLPTYPQHGPKPFFEGNHIEQGINDISDSKGYHLAHQKKKLPFNYPPLDTYAFAYPHPHTTTESIRPHIPGPPYANYPPFHPFPPTAYEQNHVPKPHPKPASDPAYPEAGYYPKDLLTKITSAIPNMYNAIADNPFLTFNKKNREPAPVWKPSKGVPPIEHQDFEQPHLQESQLPKFGFLVYNPTRQEPYFVIPANNENAFIDKYIAPHTSKYEYANQFSY